MKTRNIIILVLSALVVAALIIFEIFFSGVRPNAPGTIGNTAGNLNNHGLYCEDDGIVYFSNAYDNGYLYSMNADTTNIKRLWNVPVKYINAGDEHLYYYRDTDAASNDGSAFGFLGNMLGVYRIQKDGKNDKTLDKTPSGIVMLMDDYVYYQHYDNKEGMTLYRVKTDRTQKGQMIDAIVNPACAAGNVIYYYDMDDRFKLMAYDTTFQSITTVYEGKLFNPILQGEYFYYMNVADDYSLYRYKTSDQTIEKLTTDRVDCFNVSPSGYIYYQKNSTSDPALMRIQLDGSGAERVATGNYTDINITSTYTYFSEYDSPTPVYMTPTSGTVNVTEFQAAASAVPVE